MNINIYSIIFIILSGSAVSFCVGRVFYNWKYDHIFIATLLTVFAVQGISILFFSTLGLKGLTIVYILSIYLPFMYMKYNIDNVRDISNNATLYGSIYWMIILIVLSVAGLRGWEISRSIQEVFSLKDDVKIFTITFIVILLGGVCSLSMMMREWKKFVSIK